VREEGRSEKGCPIRRGEREGGRVREMVGWGEEGGWVSGEGEVRRRVRKIERVGCE
jgi:hypothetical protein